MTEELDERSRFPPALERFAALWNRHEFWECHEALEGAWRASRSGFYHGLILLASGYVHVQRENPHGIVAQLGKASRALDRFRPFYLGVDVDALLRSAAETRERVTAWKGDPPSRWGEVLRFPPFDLREDLVRGDEEELIRPTGRRPDQKSRKRM